MDNKKNITFKSVEEYNKKFRHSRWKLLTYSKNEVEQFDKIHFINKRNYLLKGRKWALIGDTYYEIPKAPRLTWFRNLNKGIKAAIYISLFGFISSAVVIPTMIMTNWQINIKKTTINSDEVNYSVSYDSEGNFKANITPIDQKKEIINLVIKIGDYTLQPNEYTFSNGVLIIPVEVLNIHIGNISITPTLKDKELIPTIEIPDELKNKVEYKDVKYNDDNLELTLVIKDTTQEFNGNIIIKVGTYDVTQTEYTFNKSTGKVTIKKSVIDAHKGEKVVLNPTLVAIRSIKLNKTSLALDEFSSETLTAEVTPVGTPVTWSSSSETDISVNSDGKVTALKPVSESTPVTITATLGNGESATCSVTAKALDTVDFYTCSWNDIAKRCDVLETGLATSDRFCGLFKFGNDKANTLDDFIGKERSVQLKHQNGDIKQTVRIIDTQHGINDHSVGKTDYIMENGEKTDKVAALTFEFKDLICDEFGYSLAYQWNDINDGSTANQDYPKSSIRKVLCGSGDFSNTVYCATRASTDIPSPTWDNKYSYKSDNKKTILSMLPEELSNVLKTIKKTVRTGSDYMTVSDCSDKLFILSQIEIGGTDEKIKDEGTIYKYYNDNSLADCRVKKQLTIPTSDFGVKIITNKMTICQDNIISYAGYNHSSSSGPYCLRSPNSSNPNMAWDCKPGGDIGSDNVSTSALNIAPAFCI